MNLSDLVTILAFLFGGGGLSALFWTWRKELRERNEVKRKEVISKELLEEKGAGLIVTTSSEAIAVFKFALEQANADKLRLAAERDEYRKKVLDLEVRAKYLEEKVRELEGRVHELGG